MTSDKERREVAAKLRARTKKPMGKSMQRMFTETLGIYAHHINWLNPDKATNRWDVIVNYLADLIDRPTCEMTCEGEGFRCSACGKFHDMSGFDRFPWAYCPNCGAEVVDDGR